MKKISKNIALAGLGVTTVSSIALALHFYSTTVDMQKSHEKLDEKYKIVLTENGELADKISILNDEKISLNNEISVVTGQLEQSKMENDELKKETDSLKSTHAQEESALRKEISRLKKSNEQQVVSRGESTAGVWRSFKLTYYDNFEQSTGKNPGDKYFGITASGRQTKENVSIAVDPSVIPLGTWVLIKWPDGTIQKRRADDTGGAIKGNKVDLYVPRVTESMGRDTVQVKVLN